MEEAKPKRSGKSKHKIRKQKEREGDGEPEPEAIPDAPVFEEFGALEFDDVDNSHSSTINNLAEDFSILSVSEVKVPDNVTVEELPSSQEPPRNEELCETNNHESEIIEQEPETPTPQECLEIKPSVYPPIVEEIKTEGKLYPIENVLSAALEVAPTAPPNFESEDVYTVEETDAKVNHVEIAKAVEAYPKEKVIMRQPCPSSQLKHLYNNYLLENNDEFVRQFLASVQSSYDGFELYELLSNYFRACNHLTGCEKSLSALKDNCDDHEKLVWALAPQTLHQTTTCDDGNSVDATYKIHTAKFNQEIFSQLTRTLKDIKELLKESYSLATYSVQLRKAQTDHFFHKCFSRFNLETSQAQNSAGYPSQDARSCAVLLKKCISTLFIFIRKPLLQSQFTIDCQIWIEKCAGLLLRIATIEDHLFLLNHVIRCPPRIITKWAASLIQIPPIPLQLTDFPNSFGHLHLDYALTALYCLLNKIPRRDEFLSQHNIANKNVIPPADVSSQWVVVDSDGEDEPDDTSFFKESDLISLLHQIPFGAIFRRILLVCQANEGDVHDIRFCSDHSILKLLAFATQLVNTLGSGFTTYSTDRYRQLVKLLGRLILHTVQYVTEQVQNFITINGSTSTVSHMLPNEYDAFLFTSVDILIGAKSIGTLQFLAAIPYNLISPGMLWELYSKITKTDLDDNLNMIKMELISSEFENELLVGTESNTFYILTTMSNMAVARESRDTDFIRVVTLNLFQIGFLNAATRDNCSKTARDLLSNLTQNYPYLISILIQSMKSHIDEMEKMSLFLLRELSFELWIPTENDFQLLSNWLLNFQPYSLENQICRFIFQSMNWDFGDNGMTFLPYALHCKAALLVAESHAKWESNQGVLTESVKQVSSWVTKNPDFNTWAWEIIKRFHLHGLDRPDMGAFNLSRMIQELPSFDANTELESLKKLVDEKHPLSCLVAFLLTPIGHSLPLLCVEGFSVIEVLLQSSNFEAVINIFSFMLPLFTSSRDTLVSNVKFKTFIIQLLCADMTYVRMAKNLISSEFPGFHTKLFGNMIHSQLEQCSRFGISEGKLLQLWLEILTKIENWNKDTNILYLLDVLAKFSFSREEHRLFFHSFFTSVYRDLPKTSAAGIASFLFNWSPSSTTLLTSPSYPQMPYFSYFILLIEMELENQSGFWGSLVLFLTNPKMNLENSVKKASSSSKFATNSTFLSIYRWSQQALELPLGHPILLVVWQKFFLRYFHRMPTLNSNFRDGVGERFFEGLINSAFLKKIKKRLHELLDYYQQNYGKLTSEEASDNLAENTAVITNYTRTCLQFVKAMTLWIEDPQFHQDSLYLPALPPQCLPDRLLCLVEGDQRDWTDYIDFETITSTELKASKEYLTYIHRLCWKEPVRLNRLTSRIPGQSSRHEEFMKRLNSYDQPISPPPLPIFLQILPEMNFDMYIDLNCMRKGVKVHFTELIRFAQLFSLQISQHTDLDCSYYEHLPNLYFNVDSEALVNASCAGGSKFKGCSGAGHAIFKFTEARLSERIGHIIHQNRTEYHTLISQKCVQPPPQKLCVAAVFLEDFITNLITHHRSRMTVKSLETAQVETIGIELFYSVIELINEETNFYPPTRQLLSSFVEVLGQEFISSQPGECKRLVQTCIQNPFLVGALAPHMNLVNAETSSLLEIYEDIIGIPKKDADLAFVILTKLDLWNWLKIARPKLDEISQLISLLWRAITSDGMNSERSNQMAYETYRNHLKLILMFDFPQHYSEILNYLLEGSEKQVVPVDIWFDFFNSLSRGGIHLRHGMEPFARKRELRRIATEIDFLAFKELLETAKLLFSHFTKERLSYGIYGLYPKYRGYMEPISCFLQLISYTVVAAYVRNSMGSASQKIVAEVWPLLRDIYAPWILPYNQKIIRAQCAQWIQQMNFDEASVLQPWTPNDSQLGMILMSDFTDCVLFVAETLPGSSALCSYLWNFYEENYAQITSKEHVLNIVHNCFISIPWSTFWPTIADLENMNKIVEKYLPSCHNFVGVVFPQIEWKEWVNQCINRNLGPNTSVSKSHALLLNLTIRLANEIVARESPTWVIVMETIHRWNWGYITSNSLESILNWFVMSIDPRVVLALENTHRMDTASFTLLKIASGYGTVPLHQQSNDIKEELQPNHNNLRRNSAASTASSGELNRKRYLFIRTCVRLILSTSTKYKNLVSTNPKHFELAVHNLLDDMVVVIKNEGQTKEDFSAHLKELISLMSNHYLGTIIRNAFIEWCNKNPNSPLPILYGIIQLSFAAKVQPYAVLPLIETAISLSFKHEETTWEEICSLTFVSPEQTEITQYFDVSSKDGHYLVLNALLLKRFSTLSQGGLTSVSLLTDLLKNLKPRETNEAALPLIYQIIISIAINLLKEDSQLPGGNLQKSVKKFLLSFVAHLTAVGDDKQGWGLLGALGLGKSSQLSTRGRLFARCLGVFILAQLPTNLPIRTEPDSEGHFTMDMYMNGSPTKKETAGKPHPEVQASLERLEALKLNRLYADLCDCIETALKIIRNPIYSLSSQKEVISEFSSHLFCETYLNGVK